jgi:hypothetical protein
VVVLIDLLARAGWMLVEDSSSTRCWLRDRAPGRVRAIADELARAPARAVRDGDR